MISALRELILGFRLLARHPWPSAAMVATLSLAMGSSSAIFSIANALYLRPAGLSDPHELVFLASTNPERNLARRPLSLPDWQDLRAQLSSLEGLEGHVGAIRDLTGDGRPERMRARLATVGLFELMRYGVIRGRFFEPREAEPGSHAVAVISRALWRSRFGSDPQILTRTIVLDGEPHAIVGVASPEPEKGLFRGTDVWLPLEVASGGETRGQRVLQAIGRLRPQATLEQLRAEVAPVAARLAREYPDTHTGWNFLVTPVAEQLAGPNAGLILGLLGSMVTLVLLLACANVANLMLARAAARERETALRSAVGARRWRLVRQLTCENLALSLIAGVAGLLVSWWILRGLVAVTRRQIPLLLDLGLDDNVLGFSLLLVLVAPLVFGLAPMLRVSRPELAAVINASSARATGPKRGFLRAALLSFQVALALVLMSFGALMVRSTLALTRIDLGFDPDDVLTMVIDRPALRTQGPHEQRSYFHQVEQSLAELSGLRGVALASHRPLLGGEPESAVAIAGQPAADPSQLPRLATVVVSAGFFETLGIASVQGRALSSADTAETAPVAVVSLAAMQRFWPAGTGPVGSQVKIGGADAEGPWIEIVGVVGDVRNPDADQPPEPVLYLPFAQHPRATMTVLVRTATGASAMSEPIRQAIWRADPDQPLTDVRTLRQIHYDDFAGGFAINALILMFAILALVLATGGLYSVVAYTVRQRYREIGVRRAFGARASDVVRTALAGSVGALIAGLLVGLVATFALQGLIAGMLYGVSAGDLPTLAAMTLLLAGVGLLAAVVPVRRALKIEPATALRDE